MKIPKWLWNPQSKPIIADDECFEYVPRLTIEQINQMYRSIGSDYIVGKYDPMCADVLIPLFEAVKDLQEKFSRLESRE